MNDQRNLQILLTLRDEASAKLKGVGSAMETAFKVGAVAVAGGITALGAFGVASVKAFAESQAQMARFNATIATIPDFTDKAKQSLIDASEASQKFGFDSEDTALVLARFAQATGDVKTALDLGNVAMDLATAKNIDIATAGQLVNQVLSGNGRVLKQYQIALDETKSPLEQIAELEKKVAGQTEESSKTIATKMKFLGLVFEDVKKKIGEALVDLGVGGALDFAIGILKNLDKIDFKGTFQDWAEGVKSFVSEFIKFNELGQFAQGIWQVIVDFFNTYMRPAWNSLVQTIKDNKDTLLLLTGYFTKYIGIITAGVFIAGMTALVMMFQAVEKAIKAVQWVIDKLSDAFVSLMKLIDKVIAKWQAFKSAVGGLGGSISNTVGGWLSGIGNTVGNVLGINDAVISPSGQIVTTNPNDWLIATQNPAGLGGGGITINLNGTFMSPRETMQQITDEIATELKRRLRI